MEFDAPTPLMERGSRQTFLVSCVKAKLTKPAPARDLYCSAWFSKARRYVEQNGQPWFILSAHHGLVAPNQVIAPYDRTLLEEGRSARRAWAESVLVDLDRVVHTGGEVVFIAGARYREFLQPALEKRSVSVRIPMEGLGIGLQLQWLTAKLN